MKKLILTLIVLAVVGGGAAAYYMRKNTPEPTVTTLQLTRGDIVDSVGSTGTLEAVETVDVGTQVSGTVQDLYADFNDIVKKGQVIARLDPSLLQTQIEQQRANVTRAEADLDRLRVSLADAEQKLSRAKELSARNLIPRTELETAEINVKTQDAQIRSSLAGLTQARSQLNTAQVNLGHTVIRSPIDGIVISRNVDQGQTVAASMNAPVLYSLAADLTKMQVLANIDEAEIGKMRPGQPVSFRVDAYPTDTFHGAVHQVRLQPTTVQNVVTYSTVISVPNEEYKLKPGMTANVTIEVSRKNNVLRAPAAALRFRPTNDIFAALKQDVPPELQRGLGRGGQGSPGAQGGQRGAGFSGASGQQPQPSGAAPSGQAAPQGQQPAASAPAQGSAQRQGQTSQPQGDRPQRDRGQQSPAAQGGGDRPAGDRAQGGGEGGRGGFGNMTPEEREARRKQYEERMKNMSPEERERVEARMRERGGRGGSGRGDAAADGATGGRQGAGATGAPRSGRGDAPGTPRASAGAPQGGNREARQNAGTAPQGSRIATTTATTIDALFAPVPVVESRGRVWLYINKQLKPVSVRTGITDGVWTEILETPDTAQLQTGTEVVTNVTTGLESQQRPGQQGSGSNPLMPQRGQPGRGAPGGGGRGR